MSSPSGSGARAPWLAVLYVIAAGAALQIAVWLAARGGLIPENRLTWILRIISWTVILVLAAVAVRRLSTLTHAIDTRDTAHRATLDQVEQLEAHNEMLQALAQSTDVTLAFQALARRVARIVPCDRVGLALLKDGGQEFQTFTARVTEPERRTRPRVDLAFNLDRTHIGHVVRTGKPLIVDDFAAQAADFLDANVLHQTGFQSGLVLPLLSKGKAVGTLNVVSRASRAFTDEHRAALAPIAEILAVAYVAQQLQQAVARYRTMEAMAELTLSIASEIQSALQTIVGHCDLLERGYPDAALQRDVAVISTQAQRIQDLLERMRTAAQDRLREVAEQVQGGIPPGESVSRDVTGNTWRAAAPGIAAPRPSDL
jgi:GAF domain-containing protein